MKLQFKIDSKYLIHHASDRYYSNPTHFDAFLLWTPLVNRINKKYQNLPAYYFLNFSNNIHLDWASKDLIIDAASGGEPFTIAFRKMATSIEAIYTDIYQSKEFKKLRKETEAHLIAVSNQWEKNKKFTLAFVQEISGISLPDKTITVLITHPKMHLGRAVVEHNTILWGHTEDWINYSTIYLCHELMHILTKEKQRNEKVMHALIELMTDNELRIRLNSGGEYFTENTQPIGHKNLNELEKKILPIWQEYLAGKLKAKNIFELEKYIIKKGIA